LGKNANYFNDDNIFGDLVTHKFPSLRVEIEEAAKCLALGRGTASAFHSLRCLEAGIRAISTSLGIPEPIKGAERNWGNALKKSKKKLTKNGLIMRAALMAMVKFSMGCMAHCMEW
jgi:hypothetical protein